MYSELPRETWRYPSKDMLNKIAGKGPVLIVDLKGFRPDKGDGQRQNSANAIDLTGDELPRGKKKKLMNVQIDVEMAIFEPKEGEPHPDDLIRKDVQSGTLKVAKRENDEMTFDIDLDERFSVEFSKLFVTLERGKRWKRTMAKAYTCNLAIKFRNADDAKLVLPLLAKSPEERTALKESYTPKHISSRWSNLPTCPPSGTLLTLFRSSAGKKTKMDYGLDVFMAWSAKTETPMQSYNRLLRHSRQNQGPKPLSDSTNLPQLVRLTYVMEHGQKAHYVKTKGALCPFCTHPKNGTGKDFKEFDRLLLHLNTAHDMFLFKEENKTERPWDGKLEIDATLKFCLADRPSDARPTHSGRDARDISWVAPKETFDIDQWFAGNGEWITVGLGEKSKPPAVKQPAPVRTARKRKAPHDVPELPVPVKKRFAAPRAPENVVFFRARSKRVLSEGEMLSESDDEPEEGWHKNYRTHADHPGYSAAAQRFMARWDNALAEEDVTGDIFLSDAVVRFARGQRAALQQDPALAAPFERKLRELQADGLIEEATVSYCKETFGGGGGGVEEGVPPVAPGAAAALSPVTVQALTAGKKLRYVPGGSGGGGRYVPVSPGRRRRRHNNVERDKNSAERAEARTAGDEVAEEEGEEDGAEEGEGEEGEVGSAGPSGAPAVAASSSTPDEEALRQVMPPPSLLRYEHCLCGRPVEHIFNSIMCSHRGCARRNYHLKCVGLTRASRPKGPWKCSDCKHH
ncbi:hypothetical protein BDY21DRAFT_368371 [Lineolata rhizophorae]|uniref:Zinc finger PHD-type domain-containing protein n=1 Tax=Lineolata rhizophorae TaxID=578093 RepID=A0A6A6PE71_9PEZI|nr:hypothetical protein BDY21DRAFT_368371 [Lineolata rhizophorae]